MTTADEQLSPGPEGAMLDSWAWIARARAAARRATTPVESPPSDGVAERPVPVSATTSATASD